jgi:hypothetical protein
LQTFYRQTTSPLNAHNATNVSLVRRISAATLIST